MHETVCTAIHILYVMFARHIHFNIVWVYQLFVCLCNLKSLWLALTLCMFVCLSCCIVHWTNEPEPLPFSFSPIGFIFLVFFFFSFVSIMIHSNPNSLSDRICNANILMFVLFRFLFFHLNITFSHMTTRKSPGFIKDGLNAKKMKAVLSDLICLYVCARVSVCVSMNLLTYRMIWCCGFSVAIWVPDMAKFNTTKTMLIWSNSMICDCLTKYICIWMLSFSNYFIQAQASASTSISRYFLFSGRGHMWETGYGQTAQRPLHGNWVK